MFKLKSAAFSLLEVMVAMVIVSGAVLVLNQTWTGNNLRVRKALWQNQMAFLLERKMIELETEHGDGTTALDDVPEELSGDFSDVGDEFSDFSWRFKTQKFSMPSLLPSLSEEVRGNETFERVINQMTDHINQSVLEAQLTVTLQRGGGSVDHHVTTYFVDYKRNISTSE